MPKPALISKNSIVLLVVIATLAVVLSIFSYQYSTSTSKKIVDIASEEVRSNARIEVHNLSQILANRLQTITPLLQTLADAPALQNNEYQRAQVVINDRQNYTNDLTDFYMWLDQNGKIVWISNINSTIYQKYKDFDLSYRPYFIIPKTLHRAYYSSLIESNDKVPRLYISYPILSKQGPEYLTTNAISNTNNSKTTTTNSNNYNQTKSNNDNIFEGVVVAAIKITTISNILKNQLLPHSNSSLGLLDDHGVILYANNQSYIGKQVFGNEFQSILSSLLPTESKRSVNELLRASLLSDSNAGLGDIHVEDTTNTLAYEPVSIMGRHFLTLYVAAPHNLATNVSIAIELQKNFSTFMVIIIGAVAIGAALLVLIWNKRLETTVNTRTDELRKANELLTESNNRLAAANEQLQIHGKMQQEFINVAAHELRTPIQPILGLIDLLRSKIKNKEQHELLDIIYRNAKRLQRLSQDILDVTKIETGSMKLNKEKLDLHDVILRSVEENREQIQKYSNVNTNSKLKLLLYEGNLKLGDEEDSKQQYHQQHKNPIFVEADRERITQVISNLLSNALKFTKEGTISISTEVLRNNKEKEQGEENKDYQEVIVSVKDNGEGIDPKILPRLFTKFATTSFEGTGLGLYISKNIIEAHGGKIWAENNRNDKGAAFYFTLPLTKNKEYENERVNDKKSLNT